MARSPKRKSCDLAESPKRKRQRREPTDDTAAAGPSGIDAVDTASSEAGATEDAASPAAAAESPTPRNLPIEKFAASYLGEAGTLTLSKWTVTWDRADRQPGDLPDPAPEVEIAVPNITAFEPSGPGGADVAIYSVQPTPAEAHAHVFGFGPTAAATRAGERQRFAAALRTAVDVRRAEGRPMVSAPGYPDEGRALADVERHVWYHYDARLRSYGDGHGGGFSAGRTDAAVEIMGNLASVGQRAGLDRAAELRDSSTFGPALRVAMDYMDELVREDVDGC